MFGQVISFRGRPERASAPAKPVHRSLSAALADVGLAEPPALSELTVEPEAGLLADEPLPAELPPPPETVQQSIAVIPAPAPAPEPSPVMGAAPIPHRDTPASPPPIATEAPLPRVIALATPRPPDVASYPWVKSARRRRFRRRLSETVSWLVTIAIVSGMIGVAAIYLTPLRSSLEPVAQQ